MWNESSFVYTAAEENAFFVHNSGIIVTTMKVKLLSVLWRSCAVYDDPHHTDLSTSIFT